MHLPKQNPKIKPKHKAKKKKKKLQAKNSKKKRHTVRVVMFDYLKSSVRVDSSQVEFEHPLA